MKRLKETIAKGKNSSYMVPAKQAHGRAEAQRLLAGVENTGIDGRRAGGGAKGDAGEAGAGVVVAPAEDGEASEG